MMEKVAIGIALLWAAMVTWKLMQIEAEPRCFTATVNRKLNEYLAELQKMQHKAGDFVTWLQINKIFSEEVEKTKKLETRISGMESTVDIRKNYADNRFSEFKEEMMKLRENYIEMNERISNKRPLFKLPAGTIKVQMYHPSKNLGAKKA